MKYKVVIYSTRHVVGGVGSTLRGNVNFILLYLLLYKARKTRTLIILTTSGNSDNKSFDRRW